MCEHIIEKREEFHRGFNDGYRQGLIEGQRLGQEMMMKAVEMQSTKRYVFCEHCKDDYIYKFKKGVE